MARMPMMDALDAMRDVVLRVEVHGARRYAFRLFLARLLLRLAARLMGCAIEFHDVEVQRQRP